jgi:1-acyl-sn-glycerol-3-phosphate acyltransferase
MLGIWTLGDLRIGMGLVGQAVFRPPCLMILSLIFNMRFSGQGNLPARSGAILACNHASFLEPIMMPTVTPGGAYLMARKTLFDVPLFGAFIRNVGAFPVDQGRTDLASIRQTLDLLGSGAFVVIFPEGTRTIDGSLGRFRNGIGMLSRRARVPVVPVAIAGTFTAWPRQRTFPRPARVSVRFGQPLTMAEGESEHDFCIRVRGAVEALLGLQQGGSVSHA